MNNITLYSTGCQKCIVLKTILKQANISFNLIEDNVLILDVAKAHGITGAPILEVDGNFYDFRDAIKYLNNRRK